MKKFNMLIYALFIVLILSCEKESDINFGFDSLIVENSNGLVIADVSHHVQHIYLNGIVSIEKGEVEVYLLNPNGVAVYSKKLIAPNELKINETFEAKSGYWRLKYLSREGVGEIDLHIFND